MPRPNDVGVGVALVVLNDKDQVLMLHRQGAHGADTWSFPGGWVDRTDTFLEWVCVREAREEFGIEVDPYQVQLLGATTEDFPDFRTVTVYFWTRQFTGLPRVCEPHKASEWKWADPYDPPNPRFGKLPAMWHLIVKKIEG